jgi:hypothetical protein
MYGQDVLKPDGVKAPPAANEKKVKRETKKPNGGVQSSPAHNTLSPPRPKPVARPAEPPLPTTNQSTSRAC